MLPEIIHTSTSEFSESRQVSLSSKSSKINQVIHAQLLEWLKRQSFLEKVACYKMALLDRYQLNFQKYDCDRLCICAFDVDVSYASFIKTGGYSQKHNYKVNNFLTTQPQ